MRSSIRFRDSRLSIRCIRQKLAEELEPMAMTGEKRKTDMSECWHRDSARSITYRILSDVIFAGGTGERRTGGCAGDEPSDASGAGKTDDRQILRLVLYTSDFNCPPYFPGFESTTHREVLAEVEWNEKDIVLEIEMDGEMFTFRYGCRKRRCMYSVWQTAA